MKPIRKTLKEKGWMLKMAGTSISSRIGSKVIGKYGTYLIKYIYRIPVLICHLIRKIIKFHRRADPPLVFILTGKQPEKCGLSPAVPAHKAKLPVCIDTETRIFKNIIPA